MNDIAKHMPEQSRTVAAIYAYYKKTGDTGFVSKTLSVSLLGHVCERYLWYCFRQCCKPEFSGRMYRLFETGNLEEARFVKDLREIGCTVHDVDGRRELERTKQFKVTALGGHLKGYMDGCALGIPEAPKTWHVLEFKTHNNKLFQRLIKGGVKESHHQHYLQMIIEMHLTGMRRALYLARNKDTDDLHSERIHYNADEARALMDKAERIIVATSPPGRIADRPDFYHCNWCDAQAICWNDETSESALPVPSLSCRHCCHATPLFQYEDGTPIDGAKWGCNKHEVIMDNEKSCDDHLILPGLIPFAEATNYGSELAGDDSIEFTNKDGSKWYHGKENLAFSSAELIVLAPRDLTSSFLLKVKELFGAVATSCSEDILNRYPREDSRSIWEGDLGDLIWAWQQHYKEELTELTAVAKCNLPDHSVAEYSGGRLAIAYPEKRSAEIREGVE